MSDFDQQPRRLETSWDTVVLVCGACRTRGSGPRKAKAAAIVEGLRTGLKRIRPRPRLIVTGCLGPCPKKAITVAIPGADGRAMRVWAIASADEAAFVTRRVRGSSDGPIGTAQL